MPISDEIIELEPVKKNKSRLIVMFVVMGVLLALAATFLVLWIVKPNVEPITDKITGVTVETSSLFNTTGDGTARENVVSVGNEYEISAVVSTEGDGKLELDKTISWECDPYDAIAKYKTDVVDGKNIFTFTPAAEYAGQYVTITARSRSDADFKQDIRVKIVKQGTEEIKLYQFWRHGASSSARTDIRNNEIEVPLYTTGANNKQFYVTFEQFGAWDESTQEYSKLTVDGETNKIDISVSDGSIISAGTVSENGSPARFEFTPRGLGNAEITLTANNHNDFAEPFSVKLKVSVKSNAEKRYIDNIYIVDKPVDTEFFKSRMSIPEADWFKNTDYTVLTYGAQGGDTPLVLPYNGSYNEILSHLVISPLTVQYNAAEDEQYSDWMGRIKVESSNPLLKVTRSGNEKPNITGSGLVNGDECSLTFSDVSSSSIGAEKKIRVNVVANNAERGGAVAIGDRNDAWLTNPNNKVETSPNVPLVMRVAYTFLAPDATTEADTMLSKGYVSTSFVMTMSDPDAVTVKVGETTIESGKQYDFTKSLVITKAAGMQNTYMGTADVNIMFNESAEDGAYTIQFRKIGTTIVGASEAFNALNPDWTKSVNFNVTKIATKAEFKTRNEILEIVSDRGTYAADFVLDRAAEPDGTVWKSTARLYLQHRPAESDLGFDFADLVQKYGTGDTLRRLNVTSTLPFNRTNNIDQLKYTSDLKWPSLTPSLNVTIEQRNSSNATIAELNVTVYVIDAVKSITATSNVREAMYTANDFSNSLSDSLSFEKVFGTPDTERDLLSDVDITLAKTGILLEHDWEAGSTVEYKYGGDTLFYYEKTGGSIKPARDLFAYGYEENIPVDEIKVTYKIAEKAWQKAISQDSSFTFTRSADDVYVYGSKVESYLDEYRLGTDESNSTIYSCYVNQLETLNLYATSVVKYGSGESAREIIVEDRDSHTGHAVSSVVRAYLSVKDGFKNFINSGSAVEGVGAESGLYYNFSFTSPAVMSTTGTDSYDAALIVYGSSKTKSLTVKVQNLSRPISDIKLFDAKKNTPSDGGAPTYECGDKQLTETNHRFVFGAFNDAPVTDGMPYIETFFIKITYSALSEGQLFTRFEPISLQLPHYISYRIGLTGEYVHNEIDGASVWSVEIAKPAISDDLIDENIIEYTVQCFIRVEQDCASDVVGDNNDDKNRMVVYASYHDSSNTLRQRVPIGVITGLDDIKYYVDNRGPYSAVNDGTTSVECTMTVDSFDQSQSPVSEISTEYVGLSVKDGYNGIKYDPKNLTWLNRTDNFGIFDCTVDDNGISVKINPNRLKALTSTELQQYKDGRAISFVFRDTAGGGSKDFTVSLKIKVEVRIIEFTVNGDSYSIVTNGKTDGTTAPSNEITVTLNGGIANELITEEERGRISFEVCEMASDGTVSTYTGGDISIVGNKVHVKNDFLTTEQKYYVRAKYVGGATPAYSEPVKLVITTSASKLELAESGNIAVETAGGVKTANVKVKNSAEKFRLAAVVKNNGTGNVTNGAQIVYKLYSDANAQTELLANMNIASIDSFGDITFSSNLTAQSGVFYYRASYFDTARGENIYSDIVKVNYSVALTSVELINAPASDTYTFYYYSGATTGYTTLTLEHTNIRTEVAFGGVNATGIVYRITNDSQNVLDILSTADKFVISPKGVAGEGRFTLTAEYNGSTVEKQFKVNVVIVPALELSANSGTIKVFKAASEEGGKVTFSPKALNSYDGLSLSFAAESDGKILKNVNASTGEVTLTLDRSKFDAGRDETYTVALTATYNCNDSLLGMVNPITTTSSFTLTVSYDMTYVPSFDFTAGGAVLAVSPAQHEINKTAAEGFYQIELTAPTGDWYVPADWSYSATSANSPIESIDNFGDGGKANVALKAGTSGAAEITLSATAYGKSFSASKTYILVDSGAVSAKLETTYNSATATVSNGASLPSDFTSAADARTFVYTIDASGLGVDVSASDVKIDHSGYATMTQDVTETATNIFTVVFRADKAFGTSGAFTVRSSVIVNGKTYYPTTGNAYTVTLTATETEYALGSDARILPDETTTFTVANKGDAAVTYSIVSGDEYATIDGSTGVLTPKAVSFTADRTVLVRASVAVGSGAFAGRTYVLEKAVVIVGVPLPDVVWNDGINRSIVLTDGGVTIDMSRYTISSVTAVGKTQKTYDFTGAPTYSVTAQGLTEGVDYSTNGSTLTVNKTDNTLAGGKFVVRVTVVLSGAVNNGQSVSSELIEFVIVPQAKPEAVTRAGAVGTTYDIYGAAKPYTGVGDNQIKSDDNYTVSYALKTPNSKLSVDGRYLTVKEFVSDTRILLTATITMTDGAYVGTVMTVDAEVNLNVFTANATNTIAWQQGSDGAAGGYGTLDVASLLSGKFDGKTVTDITVDALTHGAFVSVANNGSSAPAVGFASDINVSNGAHTETVVLAYTVKCADNSVYYGQGTVNVASIAPELAVYVDGIALDETSGTLSYNTEGGSSFGAELREKHGLPVDGIEIGYNGGYLQFVKSGAHMVVTASDADSSENVALTVSVCGLSVTKNVTVNITKRQATAAFTSKYKHSAASFYMTDRTLSLASGSTTDIEFKWTASDGSAYRYPYTMTLAAGSSNRITNVKAELYRSGSVIGTYNSRVNSSSVTLSLYDRVRELKQVDYIVFTVTFDTSFTDSYNLGMTLRAYNDTNYYYGSSASTQVSYSVSVGSAEITLKNMNGMSDGTVSITAGMPPVIANPNGLAGYTFGGWYRTYSNGIYDDSYTPASEYYGFTLYAKWDPAMYEVTLDPNEGALTGTETKINATYNGTYSALGGISDPTRTGYTFGGWYTESVNGSRVTSATTVTNTSDHTLYAHWTANTYSVTFNPNNGSANIMSTVTYGAAYTAPTAPEFAGYTFDGWFTAPTGGDRIEFGTSNPTKCTTAAHHSLYAHWTANTYNVTVDYGYTGSTSGSITVTFDKTFGEADGFVAEPTREGYTFIGWFDAAGNRIAGGTKVGELASGYTITARWIKDAPVLYTVTFKVDNSVYATQTVISGGKAMRPKDPSKVGYKFIGWNVVGGTGGAYDFEQTVSSDMTLTASFVAKTFTVKLELDGGSMDGNATSVEVTYDVNGAAIAEPTKDGYTFGGWYGSVDLAESTKLADNKLTFENGSPKYTKLYAKWKAVNVRVVYDVSGISGATSIPDAAVAYGGALGTLPSSVTVSGESKNVEWHIASAGGAVASADTTVTLENGVAKNDSNYTLTLVAVEATA